ncbi:MAG: HAD-IB family phosphatase [archaeon]|nr:HAD-IB family phosphatase [archaeon]
MEPTKVEGERRPSNEKEKKTLIIFDFDETISKYNTLNVTNYLFKGLKTLKQDKFPETADEGFNTIYGEMKDKGVSIKALLSELFKTDLNPNMIDLLNYFRENKDKYELYIISCNIKTVVEGILDNYGFKDLFTDIYGVYSEFDESKNELKATQTEFVKCDLCFMQYCKTHEMNKIFKEKKREDFKKIIFIADGLVDFCIAKHLSENDFIFPRKDAKLHKLIMDESKGKIKCEYFPWENGLEILNEIKKF